MQRTITILSLCIVAVGANARVSAEPTPAAAPIPDAIARLDDATVRERSRTLENFFQGETSAANWWYYGFLTLYGAGAGSALATAAATEMPADRRELLNAAFALNVAPRDLAFVAAERAHTARLTDLDRALAFTGYGADGLALTWTVDQAYERGRDVRRARENAVIDASGNLLGLAAKLSAAYPLKDAAEDLARMPAASESDRRARLAQAEDLLNRSADFTLESRGWAGHALALIGSALPAIALVAGYDRPADDGYRVFALNFTASLAEIWLQPADVVEFRDRYRRETNSDAGAGGNAASGVRFAGFAVRPNGFLFVFQF
jgi:hypothetical protein